MRLNAVMKTRAIRRRARPQSLRKGHRRLLAALRVWEKKNLHR
jgi:hypothetical protein